MAQPDVTVIIPTRNESESIGRVIDEVHQALEGWSYEIMVVDTESTDGTVEIASSKGAIVVPEPRRGYGRAYKTGFTRASGRCVATLDADLTYPAGRIPEFLRILDGDVDFISGDRLSQLGPRAMTGMHRIGNTILNLAFRFLFRYPIKDSQSGMWVFRHSALESLSLVSDGMPLSEEIKAMAITEGLRFVEIPIEYRPRVGEKKIRSFADAWGNLLYLFKKRFGWVGPSS